MKRCFKCGAEKPIAEFYPHPRMADGHLNKCKACTKRDVRNYLSIKTATPEGLERERERGREKYRRLYCRPRPVFAAPDEVKRRARNALSNAVRDGKILKPKRCEQCGSSARLHGHHEDYFKPLDVRWLCTHCHGAVHGGRRAA